ncbi:MAG TPA: hypothetical protein VF627_03615, partial [Abditibacterium sp.]
MGSNRKLLFGGLFLVTGLVLWGLLSVLNRANRRVALAPASAPALRTQNVAATRDRIAYATADIPAGSIVTKGMV